MCNSKRFAIPFLLLISLFSISCKKDENFRIDLNNTFFYCEAPQDSNIHEIAQRKDFIKLTNKSAENLSSLLTDENNFIWLKTTFTIPDELKGKDLGLFISCLRSADIIYCNEYKIGKYGDFPPEEFSSGFRAHYYPVPNELLHPNSENTFIIKVWPGAIGTLSNYIFIGTQKDAYTTSEIKTFFNSKINLIFSGSMFLVFVFYLIMQMGLRKVFDNSEYIIFALLNLFTLQFLFPFYSAELPWTSRFFSSFLSLLKYTMCIGAFITIYFANSFIITFLKYKQSKHTIELRLLLLALPICITCFIPTYKSLVSFIPFITAFVLLQFCFSIPCLIKALKSPDRKITAYQLLGGFAPVILSLIIDIIIRLGFRIKTLPYITIYGWQLTIIVFLCYLVTKFNNAYSKNALLKNKLKEFNANLEDIVSLRTKELSEANFVLTRGLEAVSNVQKNFLPSKNLSFPGWSISTSYSILTDNVSGDLYDYYIKNGELCGLGIFDVSGHGIPAGLMTILAKGIINQHFMTSLDSNENLTTVMNKINNSYIHEKVNVENYITGILMRFSEISKQNICNLELVNAGHPIPLYYDSKNDELIELKYKNEDEQYGMLGIEGLEVSFPVTKLKTHPNDILVLYTDGLTEAKDNSKEQFGIERLKKIIKNNKNKNSEDILNAINKEFQIFSEGELPSDDKTIIVAKRHKISDFIEEL